MGETEWRLLYVLAVVLFLGNLLTNLFWAAHAARTRDPAVVGSTFAGIRRSDLLLTLPGALGIAIGGAAAATRIGPPVFEAGWILWAAGLLGIGFVVLATVRTALQRDIHELLTGSVTSDEVAWSEFDLLYRYWWGWTVIAVVAPLLAVVLMVYRPPLPGF